MGMKPKFPKIHNAAKAKKKNGKLCYTYMDSYGNAIYDEKHILTPKEICQKVCDRMERFKLAGPGSRESEISRAERKWISAHDESIIREAWDMMDEYPRMELAMMLDADAHHGISDPRWAKSHEKDRHEIVGDNQVPL